MNSLILGISAFYHDSAATLIGDNGIIAAAHEERFTRIKHDARFPSHTIRYLLAEAGVTVSDLQAISFYDKPFLKFERLLETYHSYAPRGVKSFRSAIPAWIKEKLFMRQMLWKELENIEGKRIKSKPPLLFPEHHLSHAASAFYPSPFSEAAILTIDGVGEWATTTIGYGRGRDIHILRELRFPHSLGLLYSAFTYFCGFKVNSGEYKLMGLAPYGNPIGRDFHRFRRAIVEHLVDIRDDGSILLNMDYFDFPLIFRLAFK
jgi:carbamoyltransferase